MFKHGYTNNTVLYIIKDILGVDYTWILVHRTFGAQHPISHLVSYRSSQGFLDDRIFQSARIFDSYATGKCLHLLKHNYKSYSILIDL